MNLDINVCLTWDQVDEDIRASSAAVITSHASEIIESVYMVLLNNPDTAIYLDQDVIQSRLKKTLTSWLKETFQTSSDKGCLGNTEHQHAIGKVHARIGIPLSMLNMSSWLIKSLITDCLVGSNIDDDKKILAVTASHNLIDQSMNIMDGTYFEDVIGLTRDQEALRINLSGQQLSNDCERAKSSLFEWLRHALIMAYEAESNQEKTTELPSDSEFGLWVQHKSEIYFGDTFEVKKLHQLLDKLDLSWREILSLSDNKKALSNAIKNLNHSVTKSCQILSEMSSKSVEIDSVRDPLTRLLNRRNMPHILQRETMFCLKNNQIYSILLIDIDKFKKINDEHGHPIGDLVLSHFSELLRQQFRTSDFIFRYGGEEFLVLLVDTNQQIACAIADKIRKVVEKEEIEIKSQHILKLTCSVGISTYDSRPDYEPIVIAADNALLRAKQTGRNKVVFEAPI